nr:sigma-70 family RNA polymerase sigma factor [Amphibacillus marinus]
MVLSGCLFFLFSLSRNHHTAEDLVQETFLRAHLGLENFQGKQIKSWLLTIAHHAFVDHYRKHKRIVVKEERFFYRQVDQMIMPEDQVMMQLAVEDVFALMADLPEKYKVAVLLRDFHQLSYEEAAQIMNVKKAHFKVLLFRGRQAIRKREVPDDE